MAAGGKNTRAGIVGSSSFFSSSRFCCTCSSCLVGMTMLPMSLMAGSSLEFDAARLVALGSRQEQREEPIAIFRLDAIRIDLEGGGERAIEVARHALAPMDAHVVRIIDALLAGDADGVGLGLDLQ